MTDPQHDPQALDDLLSGYRNEWYSRGCRLGRIISDLDPGPFRERLIGYLSAPPREVSHAAICAAIKETLGEDLRSDMMGRHRAHKCGCGPEVWE